MYSALLFIWSCTEMSKTKYFNLFSKGRLIKCMRWNHFRAWSKCLVCVIVYQCRGFILLFVIFWKDCSYNCEPGSMCCCSAAHCCFSFKCCIKKREIPSLYFTFCQVKLNPHFFLKTIPLPPSLGPLVTERWVIWCSIHPLSSHCCTTSLLF